MTTLKSVKVIRGTGRNYKKLHLIAIFDTGMVERKTFTYDDKTVETLINTMTDEQASIVKATRVNGKYVDYDAPKFSARKSTGQDDDLTEKELNFKASRNDVRSGAESEIFG
jgi:hypothetical protein